MKLITHYLNDYRNSCPEIINWRENYINDSLFYSFRTTQYTKHSYPSSLHYHDYYELVIYMEGNIHYICESATYHPQHGDIILIPPHQHHMSVIDTDSTLYKRHVFYLYPNAFHACSCDALTSFLETNRKNHLLTLSPHGRQELLDLLLRLDCALQQKDNPREFALALGLILQIFYWLGRAQPKHVVPKTHLPENVILIQRFINEHYAEINSVADVANHFYYSREYISRLFRQHFNTSVADYIMQCRIAQSQILIMQGEPLSDICYRVGFGSFSSFIRAFRKVTKMTPAQYRLMYQKGQIL